MDNKKLRSQQWFGKKGKDGFIYRAWMKNQGIPAHELQGKPVIGICNTWSELTPCNAHFRELAESSDRRRSRPPGREYRRFHARRFVGFAKPCGTDAPYTLIYIGSAMAQKNGSKLRTDCSGHAQFQQQLWQASAPGKLVNDRRFARLRQWQRPRSEYHFAGRLEPDGHLVGTSVAVRRAGKSVQRAAHRRPGRAAAAFHARSAGSLQ